MPTKISLQPSLVSTPNGEILACGGLNNEQKCLELKDNQWKEHSNLNKKRYRASAVSMKNGVYIFSGDKTKNTWEWLPDGENKWQIGTCSIPNTFEEGCAVKINDEEILLIGGWQTFQHVLNFNTISQQFEHLGDILNQGRAGHACVLFNDKIIISGSHIAGRRLSSTETINLHDLKTSHYALDLIEPRAWHGLVVVHVNNKLTVLAVGGFGPFYNRLDSIELWNSTTEIESWTMTSKKLSEAKSSFGSLSVPIGSLW